MRAWFWTVLVLGLCVLGLAAAPLDAPVTALDPATASPTSLFWDDPADEAKSPWAIRSPARWSFTHLVAPRLPRSPRALHADSALFAAMQAGERRHARPEFRQHDASLSSTFSPLRC
jgi:hypothetical protein